MEGRRLETTTRGYLIFHSRHISAMGSFSDPLKVAIKLLDKRYRGNHEEVELQVKAMQLAARDQMRGLKLRLKDPYLMCYSLGVWAEHYKVDFEAMMVPMSFIASFCNAGTSEIIQSLQDPKMIMLPTLSAKDWTGRYEFLL